MKRLLRAAAFSDERRLRIGEPRTRTDWFGIILRALALPLLLIAGAAYGMSAYWLFTGKISGGAPAHALMLHSFLAGVPFAMGALIGYLAHRREITGAAGAGALAIVAVCLWVFAAGAFFREGTICILMALPLFWIFAALGVLIGQLNSRKSGRYGFRAIALTLIAPAIVAPLELRIASPSKRVITNKQISIAATPDKIWPLINFPLDIKPDELKQGVAYRIGVPYPIEAKTIEGKIGGKRELRWQRGVSFDEVITDWQPEKRIAWRYAFGPNSFPPGSLDDHVVIGGRYFDLVSTAYTLTPIDHGLTLLAIVVETRVTTNFNWYASLWAQYLVDDTAETILQFYRRRAEQASYVAIQ